MYYIKEEYKKISNGAVMKATTEIMNIPIHD